MNDSHDGFENDIEPDVSPLKPKPGSKPKQGTVVKVGGVEKRLVTLESLNDRFALLEAPGAASVFVSRLDGMPIQENNLKRRLANEVVLIGMRGARKGEEPGEKPIYEGAFKFWVGHAHRHLYRRVAFTSKELPPDTLNLFRGFGVTPRAGKCDLILAHIYEVICSGDAIVNEALLDLMAWQMQRIGDPSRIVVVMKTKKQQVGKGLLLSETMLKIYGPTGFTPATTDQVIGRFNDSIVGRTYFFFDEVMFAGDRRAANAIKRLATATSYGIEHKGLPIIQCPVGVNFWLASNHDVAAHIEEQDARYWVLEVSEHRFEDTAYFSEVMEEIENGGREAFAYYLLKRDVSRFVPMRDVPKNNVAKQEMIRLAINPYDARKWLEECCETGQLIGHRTGDEWAPWVEGFRYPFKVFSNAYTEWQRGVRAPGRPEPTPIGSLGEVLSKAGFGRDKSTSGDERLRVLPDVNECLARLYGPAELKNLNDSGRAARWK